MRAIHLEASTLIRTDLRQANLQGAFLTGANLHEAYLEPAHGRPVNTRWTDGLIEDVGPEPGPNAHVVYWSSVEEQP